MSDVPCHSCTRGNGPVNELSAARTRSPHAAAVFVVPGLWHGSALDTSVAHSYGRPSMIAPAANRSGHVASITAVNAAPAENPVT